MVITNLLNKELIICNRNYLWQMGDSQNLTMLTNFMNFLSNSLSNTT
ncbi:Uncharacterised protein [Mycobacterium tuberculosis]|nr:Uncharacterised protein [Mycobacterium tuberculosis]